LSEELNEELRTIKCDNQPKYDRILVLVMDALRYDFVEPKSDLKVEEKLYHNNFPNLVKNMKTNPTNYLMCSAYSHPPTVTAQRLKVTAI